MKKFILTVSLLFCLPARVQAREIPPLRDVVFETSWAVPSFEGAGGSDFVRNIRFNG